MVIVIGGGYAGRMALARVRAAGLPATLVDGREAWVERTRLHQAAARGLAVERPLAPFAERLGANFVRGRVARIEAGAAVLEDGRTLAFDAAIVASGSTAHELDDAAALHAKVCALPDGAEIAVIGAGLTGIELATELAEAHPRLRVSLHGPLRNFSPAGIRVLEAAFARLGVRYDDARVESPLDVALAVSATGFRAPGWLAASGLPVDDRGRIVVRATLQVEGRPEVVAAGDNAATPYRSSCAVAMPMGCHAADTVVRHLRGGEPRPFQFGFFARCLSLGRGSGLFQLTHPDDAPRSTVIGGRAAAWIKEAILRSTVAMPEWEASAGVPLYAWPPAGGAAGTLTV